MICCFAAVCSSTSSPQLKHELVFLETIDPQYFWNILARWPHLEFQLYSGCVCNHLNSQKPGTTTRSYKYLYRGGVEPATRSTVTNRSTTNSFFIYIDRTTFFLRKSLNKMLFFCGYQLSRIISSRITAYPAIARQLHIIVTLRHKDNSTTSVCTR